MAIASMLESMATWSTPTVLFCVLNLVIATIFIASNFKSHNHHPNSSQSQLARQPSLLERVKSVNLSSLYYTTESHDEHMVQYDSTGHNLSQLNRAPSLLQRVKSIDFSFSSFHTAPLDQVHHEHRYESEQTHDDSDTQLVRVPEQASNTMGEPSGSPHSLLDRVKSFKLPSLLNSDHHSGETFSSEDQRSDIDVGTHDQNPVVDHNVESNKSKDSGKIPARFIQKSRSEKRLAEYSDDEQEDIDLRRPATMKASVRVHDESVDAKADDFIKRFRQQLKLQRLDSFQRFRDMLNRGTSSS
ncbi:hypothetical protein LXL04_027864 [Taraxacum kok-saghyz]